MGEVGGSDKVRCKMAKEIENITNIFEVPVLPACCEETREFDYSFDYNP